jgi:hypothetical protein
MRSSYLCAVVVALSVVACGGGAYGRSVNGTQGGYSLAHVHAKPASLLIAQKVERPLYIVLDPARVKSTWALSTASCATHSAGCEHFNLMDVDQFVRRDLKSAMENYFSHVEVVESAQALPATPHVVADVKIDDIKLNELVRGMATYAIIEMTWSFALRKNEASEYAYSFAGTAHSGDSYPTFEAGCAQLVEDAIPGMLKKWTEDGGIEALRGPAKKKKDAT